MTSPLTAGPARTTGDPSRTRDLLRSLTPREAHALARVAAGDDDLRIMARNLGVSPGTARAHLNRAVRKLGARTPEEAAALATALAPPGATSGAKTAPDAPNATPRPATTAPPPATTAPKRRPAKAGPAAPPAKASPASGPARRQKRKPAKAPRATTPGTEPAPDSPATKTSPTPDPARRPKPRPAAPEAPHAPSGGFPQQPAGARPSAEDETPADPEAPHAPSGGFPQQPAGARPSAEDETPAGFEDFVALVHTRLVQQTFLLTGHRHRAVHCVHLALGAAGRRWAEVSAADPEGWVRSAAFDLALSPWHRGGPRRTRVLRRAARRRIKVAEPVVPEPPTRLTPRDRALLKALQRLSRPRRRALVLHDTLGLSVEQLAVEVESSTAAAEARVRSARASLAREVPALVGDPADPEFVERLGELLHKAAVHGCPGPRLPSPALLVADSRLHTGLLTGAAATLTVAVGAAVAATLLGVGPADLLRAGLPAATACTAAGSGSAGPAAGAGAPGIRTPWCGPTPGVPARLVGPPARVLPSVQPSDGDDGDTANSVDALPPGPFGAPRRPLLPPAAHRRLPPPLADACVPLAHCRPRES
ncbi:sigma factor-like helix-turn-helix DNA-binding protein [Kitasatospora sp. NPDC059673]|uniref:sigma factor-like helix-turn-helix DNA-binding protein n=1 Tax=Kitasatospora sp. NPDC059673 TaxID=3346901 RepID=UPI0036B0A517